MEQYTSFKAVTGQQIIIHRINGYHIFKATKNCGEHPATLPYYIILEVVSFDGKMLDNPEDFKNYLAEDMMMIMEHINCQLIKVPN